MRNIRTAEPPTFQVAAGADVHGAIFEAIEACKVLSSKVRLRFNGVEFDVYPDAAAAAVAALEAAKKEKARDE